MIICLIILLGKIEVFKQIKPPSECPTKITFSRLLSLIKDFGLRGIYLSGMAMN